jgi:phosphatidylglycerol:prolipoprotein diacylglycerol transferase
VGVASVAEWSNAHGCKPCDSGLRRFESCPTHTHQKPATCSGLLRFVDAGQDSMARAEGPRKHEIRRNGDYCPTHLSWYRNGMQIHALTDYLSLLVGFELYLYFNKTSVLNSIQRYIYIIGALLGALVGSRLLALISDPSLLSHVTVALIFENKTIIGAILGGIIGIEIVKKYYGITRRTGDGIVIPLMVAIIIGRIGCQLTGVSDATIGVPCNWAWCFQQGDAFRRHPLPLYEIVALLLFLLPTYYAFKKKIFTEGVLFRIFIIGYFSLRFFLEFLKNDPTVIFSLTTIQIVCLAVSVIYIYDIRGELSSMWRLVQTQRSRR